jgi:cytosine/adenosine deaminase-related metal-dependent hydrolase
MTTVVFKDARVFDGWSPDLIDGCDVVVERGVIRELSARPVPVTGETQVVECGGRVLMPGLIDAHVHVYAASVNLGRAATWAGATSAWPAPCAMASSRGRGCSTAGA